MVPRGFPEKRRPDRVWGLSQLLPSRCTGRCSGWDMGLAPGSAANELTTGDPGKRTSGGEAVAVKNAEEQRLQRQWSWLSPLCRGEDC